jgi:hypothetical protein
MTLPQIIVDLMKLLFDMTVQSAICRMVLAGIALRPGGRRGGIAMPPQLVTCAANTIATQRMNVVKSAPQ